MLLGYFLCVVFFQSQRESMQNYRRAASCQALDQKKETNKNQQGAVRSGEGSTAVGIGRSEWARNLLIHH